MNSINILTLKEKALDKSRRFIIAIDGPSASGKGTIAKKLAEKFEMQSFASSIFYRKLASLALLNHLKAEDIEDIINLSRNVEELTSYNAENLYNEEVTQYCSKIAAIPEVRTNLRKPQRLLIEQTHRIILDGRDIGTVIVPEADLKLFITASEAARAYRRFEQYTNRGENYKLSNIAKSIHERDLRDQSRETSPLKAASDAFIIDTTSLDIDETLQKIFKIIGV